MNEHRRITRSPLSCSVQVGDLTVEVAIYRIENDGWTLELEGGTSTIWLRSFATDTEAMAEFIEHAEHVGLANLVAVPLTVH
ncbi:hypothetical protein AB4Z40_21655 [Bosea sp. 2YAB26]|jgi:hypothetical protein|uniref:hypothetical protein n=1 Tax=Bosea sp. 2YAB26 TaxID=3237478 RepID=UPI003F909073